MDMESETRDSGFDFTHEETTIINECARKLAKGDTPSESELVLYDLFNRTCKAEEARVNAERTALRRLHEERTNSLKSLATVAYNEFDELVKEATSRLKRVEDGQTEQN